MTTESRAWTVEELLGECSRLEALFPPKTRVEFTVGGYSSKTHAAIWPGNKSSALHLVYGPTLENLIEQVELYAAEWVMSNRTMTADDLGIAA